jgi:2-oxoglutarate dehydrogenase complex dehydrogenase (E1) component-like enzyme
MAAGEKLFDWGGAENLAYATLVDEGIPVRLSGDISIPSGTVLMRFASSCRRFGSTLSG